MSLSYKSLFFVIIFAALLFGFKLGSYALIDMDEPRYPQAAREMIQRGDYIVPYFAGEPRYDKPILFYWAEILSLKTTADNEFAGRLPSAVSALILVILCYFLGSTVGVPALSALILATSLEFFVMARLSITDMLLNLCISSTLIIFSLSYSRKISDKFLFLAAVSAALGLLCKGPVALVLPGIIIALYLLSDKSLVPYLKRILGLLPWIVLIIIVIALPWYLAVHNATAGEFTRAFFLEHNLNRYTSVVSGHKAAWWFYIPTFIVGFMPWALFLPKAVKDWFEERKQPSYENELIKFSLIWFATVIIFYSLAGTKLINYILPCYLPLAMIIAFYLKRSFSLKTITIVITAWTIALLLSVPLVLMPLSERTGAGIRKFTAMIPAEANLYTVNIERPSVTYYGHKPAKRIKSSKLVTKLNAGESLYFVIKTQDLHEIESATSHYQIMLKDKKYSFGKS
jgi:4-amino-4-deoxy-L-arabinose transferase-like glycosyltransferase